MPCGTTVRGLSAWLTHDTSQRYPHCWWSMAFWQTTQWLALLKGRLHYTVLGPLEYGHWVYFRHARRIVWGLACQSSQVSASSACTLSAAHSSCCSVQPMLPVGWARVNRSHLQLSCPGLGEFRTAGISLGDLGLFSATVDKLGITAE